MSLRALCRMRLPRSSATPYPVKTQVKTRIISLEEVVETLLEIANEPA